MFIITNKNMCTHKQLFSHVPCMYTINYYILNYLSEISLSLPQQCHTGGKVSLTHLISVTGTVRETQLRPMDATVPAKTFRAYIRPQNFLLCFLLCSVCVCFFLSICLFVINLNAITIILSTSAAHISHSEIIIFLPLLCMTGIMTNNL